MSTTRIFATGATGYIGGDALHSIIEQHTEWEYACLVRDSDKGAALAATYPKVRIVYGDLESSTKLIEEESKKADIVLNFANADSESTANAILAGLSAHTPGRPGYLISTGGTGILCFPDLEIKAFGEASNKVWDDIDNIAEIRSIPDFAPHRNVDKIIFTAGTESDAAKSGALKTAVVCPPTIYGTGRGTGNTRSIQLPLIAQGFLKRGQGFFVGKGLTKWSNVHVHDLSQLYLRLCEEAVVGESGKATWGPEGYYFAEHDEHIWSGISRRLAEKAKKASLLDTDEVVSITAEEATEYHPYGPVLWGANSRSRASRAKKLLGWMPQSPSIEDTIDEVLQIEAGILNLLPKRHAQKAAGD